MRCARVGLVTALMLAVVACASGPPPPLYVSVIDRLPPLSAERARIFFYRYYQIYQSMARPYIRLNGEHVAISEPGSVIYRDVVPGTYLISVDSQALYPNQDKTVTLAAGQILYVRVDALRGYKSGRESYEPEIFVVTLMDPDCAMAEMSAPLLSLKYYAAP